MKKLELRELIREIILEQLKVDVIGVKQNTFYLKIGGRLYGYESEQYNAGELATKFGKIMRYSVGKALAWLKKNSTLAFGGKSK